MSEYDIPSGWIQAKISDISIKGQQRKPATNESFTYVDIGSIDRSLKKISDPQVITGENAPSRARKVIENGDVLVSLTRPNLNAVALVEQKYHKQIASTGFEVIKPVLVDSRYIFALVRSKAFVDQISGVVQGALYPAAKSSDVQNFEFPLPPLAEQKVIADTLDTLLAQVESTKARLERIPQILKRFRQSVLAAAVSGRLTESAPAKTWERISIGKVALDIRYGTSKKCSESNGDTSVLRIPNIGDGFVVKKNLKFANFDEKEKSKLQLKTGDLLLIRSNGSLDLVGKVALVQEEDTECLFAGYLIRIRMDNRVAYPAYVAACLRSPELRAVIEETARSTSGVNNINSKELANLELSLPPLETQREIVRRVDQLFAHADRIEQQVNKALGRVNNLTQSILAKAFRGELTEQWRKDNPELISGENSAEALLEKIKAERAVQKPAARRARGRKMETAQE